MLDNLDFSGLINMIQPTDKLVAIKFEERNKKIVYGKMADDSGHITEPIELINIDSNFNGTAFCQALYDTLYEKFPNEIETILEHQTNGEYNYQLILMETGYMIFFPEGELFQDWFIDQCYPKQDEEKRKGTK